MKKNKISQAVALLCILLSVMAVNGCSPRTMTKQGDMETVSDFVINPGTESVNKTDAAEFEIITCGDVFHYMVRNIPTDVLYYSYNQGLCVMMDPKTGGPLTYKAYLEYKEQ